MLSTNIIKLRKTKSIHAWKTLEFSIDNLLFTTDLFKSKFNIFWDKIENKFTEDNHMFILFKIKYNGSDYTTIGNLQRINSTDKIWYLNWIINNMIYNSEYYNEIPNLSKETLLKLSTPEGLKNRSLILDSLPSEELNPIKKGLEDLSSDTEKISFSQLEKIDKERFDKVIKQTVNLDSEEVQKILKQEFPNLDSRVDSYREAFMSAMKEEIASGKTPEEREIIKNEIMKADLMEIQNTAGSSDIKQIRNVLRENFTHNTLLIEIRAKKEIDELIRKGKELQTIEDLKYEDLLKFANIVNNEKPDNAIEIVQQLTGRGDDEKLTILLENSVNNRMSELVSLNPKASKLELVEKLISENPNHKDFVLNLVNKTFEDGF